MLWILAFCAALALQDTAAAGRRPELRGVGPVARLSAGSAAGNIPVQGVIRLSGRSGRHAPVLLVGVLRFRGGWDGGADVEGASSDMDHRRSPTPPGGWEYGEEEGQGDAFEEGSGECGEVLEEQETTADRLGIDEETGRQWGPGDRYRDGVEIGPDDLDEETAKPRVTDRGTIGGGSMHSIREFVSSVSGKAGALFHSALDGWLGGPEAPEIDRSVARKKSWYKGTSDDLKNEIHERYDDLEQWYKEYGESAQQEAAESLLRGDAEGAVEALRKSNMQRSEFDVAGASVDPRDLLEGSQKSIAGGDEEDGDEDGDEEMGVEKLKLKYRGWSIEEITEEAERKAKLANTVRVPGDAETLREAIAMAREEPGEDEDEAVGGGGRVCVADSFQWNDVMVIGGLEEGTDQQLAISGETEGHPADVGGPLVSGQWALAANTWGSISSLTMFFRPDFPGARTLFLCLGGSVAFPWWVTDCEMRCAGGISVLEAQTAFVQTTHCIIGGVSGSANDTAQYGALITEKSHCIMQCCTVGYAEVAGVRASGEGVSVVDRCAFDSNGRAVMFSGEAKFLSRNSSFSNSTEAAFDPVGGSEEGDEDAKATRCDAVIQGCHVPAGETVWFRDYRPGGLFEAENTFDQRAPIEENDGGIKDDAGAFRTEVVFGDGVVKRKKSKSWRNSTRAPDDLIEVPVPKGLMMECNSTWLPIVALQYMIDKNGCSKVQKNYEIVNSNPEVRPLQVVPKQTGFLVVNTSATSLKYPDGKVLCEWVRNEKYAVQNCPSCGKRFRIRVGLFGAVRCKQCRVVLPRNETVAAVSFSTEGDIGDGGGDKPSTKAYEDMAEIEKMLEGTTRGDPLAMDPETHSLLPLPGGKVALVRRKETTESPFNTTTGGQKVGKGSISGALGRLAGDGDVLLREDGGKGGGGSENEEWRRQVAQAMCEGKGLGGGGGGELAKLLSKRQEKVQEKGKGGKDKKIKLRERSSDKREAEGPDIPQELKDRERFKVMCANGTTGDPIMDGILKKQGVTMGMGWPPPAGAAVVDGHGDLLGTKDPRGVRTDEGGGQDAADKVGGEKEAVGGDAEIEGREEGWAAEKRQSGAENKARKITEGPVPPPTVLIDDNLSKEEVEERMYEMRRRLADGESLGDGGGGQVLSEEQVRRQGGNAMNPDKILEMDRISSLYSKVYDKLEAEKRFEEAKKKVEEEKEEEESGWGAGESLASIVRDRELHDEDLVGGQVKPGVENNEDEEDVQRALLSNMDSQIKATEELFRSFQGGISRSDQKSVDELRSRAHELLYLKDEIDQTRPGWVDALKADAAHTRTRTETLFREISTYCEGEGLLGNLEKLGI